MDKLKQLKDMVIEQNVKVHAEEAPIYETIHPQLFNWYHTKKSWSDITYIFNLLDSESETRVLDLGCGTGFLTMKAQKWPKPHITAVDLSAEMLSELRRKIVSSKKERIILINKEALTFLRSNTIQYDLIMTSAFLHHLVDFKESLEVVLTHLKPGGVLYIAYEPLKQHIDNRVRFMFHRAVRRLDVFIFNLRMKMLRIEIKESHEKGMADYQTILGGIDPVEVISYLESHGNILRFDKFATRASGFLAFVSNKIIKSPNTFSIIFRKS